MNWAALGISIVTLVLVIYVKVKSKQALRKNLENDDSVEWMGPGICLNRKNYPEMKDDHGERSSDET